MPATNHNHPILVVEDDQAALAAMCEILRQEGYDVIAADNGHKGLEYLLNGSPPCIIVLDLVMRGMDGWEFRNCLRQNPKLARIPVVVVSGSLKTAPSDVAASFQKPINVAAFLDTIAECC